MTPEQAEIIVELAAIRHTVGQLYVDERATSCLAGQPSED